MNQVSTTRDYAHHVSGGDRAPAAMIERHSPATGRLVARFAEGTAADAAAAIAEAREAFDNGPWPQMTGMERAAVVRRWADLIDLDAGPIATGEKTIEQVGWELFQLMLEVASGRKQVWADKWGLANDLTLFNPAPVT